MGFCILLLCLMSGCKPNLLWDYNKVAVDVAVSCSTTVKTNKKKTVSIFHPTEFGIVRCKEHYNLLRLLAGLQT